MLLPLPPPLPLLLLPSLPPPRCRGGRCAAAAAVMLLPLLPPLPLLLPPSLPPPPRLPLRPLHCR
jgi:hypothetical protein